MSETPPGSRPVVRAQNVALSRHLREAQWSDKGTARRVNQERAARRHPSGYAGANVRGWRNGVLPEPVTRAVLAHLLTDEMGRRVTESDLGFPTPRQHLGGLTWHERIDGTTADLSELWTAETEQTDRPIDLAFEVGGYTEPSRNWLLRLREEPLERSGRRRIGAAEVEVLWRACESYQEMERRLGGGHVRGSVVQMLTGVVAPMFDGGFTDEVGRALMAVAARLTDILGYTAYDGLDHGGAQRYFIQSLRLARAADDDALAAHIFGDMARHAMCVGDVRESLALARAGQRAAQLGESSGDECRTACLSAHALARLGDLTGSARAVGAAEDAMAKTDTADGRYWIRYFTAEQMAAEFAEIAYAAGQPADAVAYAAIPGDHARLERRTASLATTVGRAHLDLGDFEQAYTAAAHALDLAVPLASRRIAEAVRGLCDSVAEKVGADNAADLVYRSRTMLGAA